MIAILLLLSSSVFGGETSEIADLTCGQWIELPSEERRRVRSELWRPAAKAVASALPEKRLEVNTIGLAQEFGAFCVSNRDELVTVAMVHAVVYHDRNARFGQENHAGKAFSAALDKGAEILTEHAKELAVEALKKLLADEDDDGK